MTKEAFKPLAMTRREIEDEGAPLVVVDAGEFAADSHESQEVFVISPDFDGLTIVIEAFRKAANAAGDPDSFGIETIKESIHPGRVNKVAKLKAVPAHSQSVIGSFHSEEEDGEGTLRVHLLADPHFTEWRQKVLDERAVRESARRAAREVVRDMASDADCEAEAG